MAQFDVHLDATGGLLIDCQADALSHLATRIVAPLSLVDRAPPLRARLNPIFEITGEQYAMITQYAATVRERDLGTKVASLASHRLDVVGAFDMLLTGV